MKRFRDLAFWRRSQGSLPTRADNCTSMQLQARRRPPRQRKTRDPPTVAMRRGSICRVGCRRRFPLPAELRLLSRPGCRRRRNRPRPHPVQAGDRGCGRRQDRGCSAARTARQGDACFQFLQRTDHRTRRLYPLPADQGHGAKRQEERRGCVRSSDGKRGGRKGLFQWRGRLRDLPLADRRPGRHRLRYEGLQLEERMLYPKT
jgi:hypothetical protein